MFSDAIRTLKENGAIVPFNRKIAEGVGYTQAKHGIHHRVQTILRRELSYDPVTNPRLPIGLEVQPIRVASPFEAYIFKVAKSDNRNGRGRSPFSIVRHDQYLVSFNFKIPGDNRLITRPVYLPFIRRGGLMYSWGTLYHTAPVIHQPGLCREHNGIFVNFDFTRKISLKYCKHPAKVLVNGKKEEVVLPGTSNLYKPKTNHGYDTDEKPLLYWLFGKYGFSGAIKRYTGKDVWLYPAMRVPELDLDKYTVVSSGDPSYAKNIQYVVVTHKENFPTGTAWSQEEHMLLVCCAAFFKAAHYYAGKQNGRNRQVTLTPLFTQINEFDIEADLANLDSADIWREILGRSCQGTKLGDVDLLRSMASHFLECERYVTDAFRAELMAADPDIDPSMDMFDFMYYSTSLMARSRLTKDNDISCMYGKRLTVVDYLLLAQNGFTSTISTIRWQLGLLENLDALSCHEAIRNALNKNIPPNLVCRGISNNGAINYFNASSESMVLGVSTHAICQTETENKKRKGKTVNLNDRTKHASASMVELANVYYIPKSAPFKMNMLNPYMETTPSLVMVRRKKHDAIIREVEADIAKIGR